VNARGIYKSDIKFSLYFVGISEKRAICGSD